MDYRDEMLPGGDGGLPHSDEAENGVLGCILLAPNESMPEALTRFGTDEVFYDLRRQSIWNVMTYLHSKAMPIDAITVAEELRSRGLLEKCGGSHYLTALPDQVPGAMNLGAYLSLVWDKFVARKLIVRSQTQIAMVSELGGASESVVARVEEEHAQWKKLLERGAVTPKNLCAPVDFGDAYFATWFDRREESYGWQLPFGFPMRIRPHEMTLFTGDNGSGKSSMLGMISIAAALQFAEGEKVVIASMEVPPEITLWIMARQLLGIGKMDKTEANEKRARMALEWLNKRVLIYNFLGITDWRELLNTFKYARQNCGGKIFIVDSVMRIGIPDDDYAMQGIVASQFADFAVKTGAHVFLVVHENKGEGRQKDKVRGSKQWTDNAHNVCAVKRNEDKAAKIEEWKQERDSGALKEPEFLERMGKITSVWDTKFILSKQRWPGSQQNASRWLYFDMQSLQFHEKPGERAFDFTL